MTFRKLVGKLHLWLGLASGLVVFIVSVTGCLYAFQEEIQDMTQPYRFVEPQQRAMLPPSVLKTIAARHLPDKELHAVEYGSPGHAAEVQFFHFEPSYYYVVYLNPYTGEVLKVKDMDADFFRIVLMGHYYLWLPPTIGQPLVASATLVFVVLLLSGLVLWWPRNKAASQQRFAFNWKKGASWKRKNYDLHTVLGFYVLGLALIFALTGLVWGFQWFARTVHQVAGGSGSIVYAEPVSRRIPDLAPGSPAIDRVWQRLRTEHPEAQVLEVHIPPTDSSAIVASVNPEAGTYWQLDYRYFDQYSLKELSVDHVYGRFRDATGADKLIRMNYDLHVGAVLGLPGKVLAFLASLLIASLPVTGFWVWWGRRKKAAQTGVRRTRSTVVTG